MESSDTMCKCLDSVVRSQDRKDDEYVAKNEFVGTVTHTKYDDTMKALLQVCSPFVCAIVHKEYEYAGRQSVADAEAVANGVEPFYRFTRRDGRFIVVSKTGSTL